MKLFTPPSITVYRGKGRYWGRDGDRLGQSVLKTGTAYRTLIDPGDEEVSAATIAYLGGRTYMVSDVEGDALTAAGYGSGVTAAVVTPIPPPSGVYTAVYAATY